MADLDWLAQYPLANTAVAAPPAPAAPDADADWLKNYPVAPGVPTYRPGQDNLLPNADYGPLDMAVHGMTFGLSDPLRAGVRAGADWAFGRPNAAPGGPAAGFDFQARSEEIARGRRQFEAEHPWLSTGANLAGSLAISPFKPIVETAAAVPSLARQIFHGLGYGTAGAAVTGAADNPEDRLAGVQQYAPVGAIGGAAAPILMRTGGAVGRGIANWWNPAGRADQNAVNQLRSIVDRDTSVGHPDLAALDQRLSGSAAPLTLTDVSPGTSRYIGSLYDTNTPAATMIGNELRARDKVAQSRILQGLDQTVGTGPETFEAVAQLQAAQKARARPLYGDAYMQPPVNPDLVAPGGELHALINTPAGQQAMRNAEKIAAQDRVPVKSRGITFNEAGDPVFTGVPSWKTLDYVKRGFDDVLNTFPRDPFTGKRDLSTYGGAVARTLGEYRDALVRENPAYGKALSAYSGDEASLDALKAGRHAMAPGLSAAEHEHIFNQYTPGDQELYRLAHANDLRFKIRNTPDTADETKRLANSTEMRDKLRTLFDTPDEHSHFVDNVLGGESTMFDTKFDIAGGSQTARRSGAAPPSTPSILPQAVMTGAGALSGGASVPAAAAAGGMAALTKPLTGWLGRIAEQMAGQSPQAQLAAARLALEPGGSRVMGLLQAPQMRPEAPSWLPMASSAATAGTTLPYLLQQGLLGLPPPADAGGRPAPARSISGWPPFY